MKARVAFLIAGVIVGSTFVVRAANVAPAGCAEPGHAGGEWRSYGGSVEGTRFQSEESAIGASTVANIKPAWIFRTGNAEYIDPETGNPTAVLSGGSFDNTPVVADGCLFLATNSGWVMALNPDSDPATGATAGKQRVLWATHLLGSGLSLRSNVITGSPVVANGIVFVGVTRPGKPAQKDDKGNIIAPATGPYVAALDEATGKVLWTSVVDAGQSDTGIAASPVFFNGMIFQGWYGSEGTFPNTDNLGAPVDIPPARGGYAILDASATCDPAVLVEPSTCNNPAPGAKGGSIIRHEYTITDAEYAAGYRGASVWCTAAFDPETNYLYACGGNPSNPKKESRYSNSLLKVDGDRSRATFGKIVDAYKGTPDQYYPGLDHQPVCDTIGDKVTAIWSQPCVQLDLDFGASPSLFKVKIGAGDTTETRTLVGDLQKAGIYHAVWADNMEQAWTAVVGVPCPSCNAGSPALDTDKDGFVNQVYAVGTPPGQLVALSGDLGRHRWIEQAGEGTHFQSTTAANGVVYTLDNAGTLGMFDASTGLPLARRVLSLDTGDSRVNSGSSGIAIARNTVYVAVGDTVIVLR